jgi:2-polyprenyl-3-methyl-5-hydroxy-6-metoxy-1,4-benzoquinol methylase
MKIVFDNYENVKLISKNIGVSKTIKLLYQNIASSQKEISSEDVLEIYDNHYVLNIVDNQKSTFNYEGFGINENINFAFQYLARKEVISKNKILDFGCGAGTLSLPLAKMGFFVCGIDYNISAIEIANKKTIENKLENFANFISINFFELAEHFDYIIFSDVIEHLSDEELSKIFKKCYEILNEDGEIIIHTPNGRSSKYKYCKERIKLFDVYYRFKHIYRILFTDKEQYLKDSFYDQTHINVMGPKKLKSLLEKCNFSIINIHYANDMPLKLNKLGLGTIGAIVKK